MFSRRGLLAACGVLLIAVGLGYGRLFSAKPKTSGVAICLLPFVNLGDDPASNWMADAGPFMVVSQLEQVSQFRAGIAHSAAEALAQGWTEALHVTYQADGGQWEFALEREDLATHTMKGSERRRSESAAGGLVWVATQLADGRKPLRPLPTQSVSAMRLFAERKFEEAARADSGFLPAWRGLAETRLRAGDPAGARQAVAQALASNPRLDDRDRLALRTLDAEASGDPVQMADASLAMAKSKPADETAQLVAASAAIRARRFDQASALYQTALSVNPANGETWNLLGYARAYAGDLDGALVAFRNYGAKAPSSANPLDSAGEVLLRAGRFAEAEEKFLEAAAKQPDFLDGFDKAKAAFARYLARDEAGASKYFVEYLERLKAKAPPTALLQGAVWHRLMGDEKQARAALAEAGKPGEALVRLWDIEDGRGSATVLPEGYRLLAQKKFAEGAVFWRKVYDQTGPAGDSIAREMLAWCLVETGKKAEAAELLRVWSFPSQPAEMFAPFFYWPRTFRLREAVNAPTQTRSR